MGSRGPLRLNYDEAVTRHLNTLQGDPGRDSNGDKHVKLCRVWTKRMTRTGCPVVFFQGKLRNVRRLVWAHERPVPELQPWEMLSPDCVSGGRCIEPEHMRMKFRKYTRAERAILFPNECNCDMERRLSVFHLPSCPIETNKLDD